MLKKTLLFLSLFYTLTFYSQISEGGAPYSFTHRTPMQIDEAEIKAPTNAEIQQATFNNKSSYCVGVLKDVNLSENTAGTWVTNYDGSRSWFLKITCKDAIGLSLHYNNLFIPQGGSLFLYNENKNHILGKFTSSRNFNNPITHTQIVEGESTIIEYHEPKGTKEKLSISINQLGYIFRGFEDYLSHFNSGKLNNLTKADPCQVDVACSPENNGWSSQIDAVVHFTFIQQNYVYVCSASVINNTAQDCTPYILTAWHCGDHTANQNLSGYTWYWNYQKTSCQPNNNGTNPSKGNETMINGTVRSTSGSGTLNNPPGNNQLAGSDFTLIELSNNIPTSYNAYYAGWDRSNSSASSGVSIHHPAGSAKKISTFTSSLSNATYNGGAYNAHWAVNWSATSNGHGVTEGGSSGSPIFNQSKRIVGQLSGGSSTCNFPNYSDLYGKMSENWTSNGTSNGAQLAYWLDPTNSNATYVDGTYAPCGTSSLSCSISQTANSITTGGTVNFSGNSSSSNNTWSWNFDVSGIGGASPSTSSSQNPNNITFNNPGTYDIQLTVTSGGQTCTSTSTVSVTNNATCPQLNNVQTGQALTVYPNPNGWGYISGWNSYGDISKAELLTLSNNNYNVIKSFSVYLAYINSVSPNATVDFNIWSYNNGQPGNILGTVSYPLSTIESTLSSTNYSGMINVVFQNPITLTGNQFFAGIKMNNFSTQDQLAIVTNNNGANSANTGWEQYSGGNWYSYDNSWSSISSLAHYMIVEMGFTPSISANQTICQGDNTTLVASGAGSNGSYIWNNNLGAGNTQTVSPNSTTTYTVTATDVNGCSATASTTVNVTPLPQVSAASSTAIESPYVFIDFFGTSQNANQFLWDFDDGNTATTQNTTHAYTSTGAYQVTFTGTNGNCIDQDQINITIINSNTAINEYIGNDFILKPNPSNGNLNLEFCSVEDLPSYVKIFDNDGKEIHYQNVIKPSTTQTIQVNLADGIYYVVTGKNKTNKLIIKK
ncbi:MAG: PKD domain-containing protein [Bacteroidota bacterium]|nr:PKD domain-containing protein [Bacteroidota bacterium]